MLKRFYYMAAYIYMNKKFNKNHAVYQQTYYYVFFMKNTTDTIHLIY